MPELDVGRCGTNWAQPQLLEAPLIEDAGTCDGGSNKGFARDLLTHRGPVYRLSVNSVQCPERG